jgi:hypothetical protein
MSSTVTETSKRGGGGERKYLYSKAEINSQIPVIDNKLGIR